MIQIYMEYFLTDQNSQVILIDCIHGISNHDVPVIWNQFVTILYQNRKTDGKGDISPESPS